MDLATHERGLLALIRDNRPVAEDEDPYFQLVARSPYLQEARRNVFLWRVYVLERTCPLTFALLRHRGLLADAVREFIARHNLSPFRETHAPAFLAAMEGHRDGLVALVAGFERALLLVRQGDRQSHEFEWPVDPAAVLYRLARGEAIGEVTRGTYRITVSGELPDRFRIRPGP